MTPVEVAGKPFRLVTARLMTSDFIEARDRAETFSKGHLFQRWVAALAQGFVVTVLRESGLMAEPYRLSGVIVASTARILVRPSSFTHPADPVPLTTLLERFQSLGPRCSPDGALTEEPADFYAQVIFACPTHELRQLLNREVGAINAVFVGAIPFPKFRKEGRPQIIADRWFLTLPLHVAIPTADLPPYLRETVARLQPQAPFPDKSFGQ